jgi:anaerobic ribonucleoside-triphosphate reductase activating protein
LKLYLSRLHFPITALGFGKRVGIWFQGCSIRCSGCISADTWAPRRGETTVAAVVETIAPWLRHADGLTVSGGEPFDQRAALEALLRELRPQLPQLTGDVLVFSGYSYEHLAPDVTRLTNLIDAIVTDPFDARSPQTLALRGSDNQRLRQLTPLGRARYVDEYMARTTPLDLMVDDDGTVWLAGIPRRGDVTRLRNALNAAGFESSSTEMLS